MIRFIKVKSCSTNLSAFYDETTCSIDAGRAVDIIYPNFSLTWSPPHPCRQAAKMQTGQMDPKMGMENLVQRQAQSGVVNSSKTNWQLFMIGFPQKSIQC